MRQNTCTLIVCDLCAGRLPFGEVLVAPVLFVRVCLPSWCVRDLCAGRLPFGEVLVAPVGVRWSLLPAHKCDVSGLKRLSLVGRRPLELAPGLPYLRVTIENLLVHLLFVNSAELAPEWDAKCKALGFRQFVT